MDSDQGKLFIGGISWETSEDKLKDYFSNYGEVLHTIVMRDKLTSRPRGFAFVVFADPSVIDRVLQEKHIIDGKTVEPKRALSREEQHTPARAGNSNSTRNTGGGGGGGGSMRTKKIFVGGLPPTLSEEGFKEYFETYGHVTDVVVMYDQNTRRPRGFGFISFDTEEAVDRVLHKTFHDLNGKQVEVKRALPKDANPGAGGRPMGAGAGSGSYQGYGTSGANSNAYDNSNRYLQSQGSSGGYPPYGSSGYNNPGYGYGSSNNGAGYGGYGNYSGSNAGYGAPAAVAYGNPNVTNASYGSGPQGGPRSTWSAQAPSGYGAMGYGNAAWGAQGGNAGAASGGPGSAPTGHSPGGAAGYGNQGYGYSGFGNQGYGYGGGDGSYGNQAGYGTAGGRSGNASNSNIGGGGPSGGDVQGNGGGYMGNGYGDANGNSGYGNAAWRSDGGQVGYTGGYAGGQARQAQQQ